MLTSFVGRCLEKVRFLPLFSVWNCTRNNVPLIVHIYIMSHIDNAYDVLHLQ